MYNIYYLMRRRGKPADRVKATVKFLVSMYDPESAARRIKAVSLSPDNSNTHHTLACILSALGKGSVALESSKRYLQDTALVESKIEDAIELFVELAASGLAKEALEMLVHSEAEKHLEPLVVGLKLHIGEDVKTAPEIREIAKDVVKRIEERKKLRGLAAS